MKQKCDRCGLHPPTVRKILRHIVPIGRGVALIFEHACIICVPVLRN